MIVLDPTVRRWNDEDLARLAGEGVVLDLSVDPPAIHLGSQGLSLDDSTPSRFQRFFVRAFDLVAAITGMIVLAPVFVLTAAAIGLTSRGGVLFRSERAGQGSSQFSVLKFRSMNADAERRLEELLETDPAARAEYEQFHKLRRDPRVTRVGRLLRRTSLDEIPQLLNVFRGQMSIVGPRPNLLTEVEAFGPALATVLRVKPGLTGLWQVSGRSTVGFDERIMLDTDYALNRSIMGDVKICLRTVPQLFSSKNSGAY